jgi:hypothetical protein
MVETEREILREKDEETKLGERKPFDSSRQAEYEDSVAPAEWHYGDEQRRGFRVRILTHQHSQRRGDL